MFMLILAFLGCTSAEGSWEGTCAASGYSYTTVLDISDDKGGDLTGDFTVRNSGYSITGPVDGSRDKKDVDLDITVVSSGYSFPTTFSGEMDGDDMDGTWVWAFGGYTQSYACDLSRD